MELLEAYKLSPAERDTVRLYEFRGKLLKQVETTDETGQQITKMRMSKLRCICVAADTLIEAILHLREYRPDYYPQYANLKGTIYLKYQLPECDPLRDDTTTISSQ